MRSDSSMKSQLALRIIKMSRSENVLTSSAERIGSCWIEDVEYSILIDRATCRDVGLERDYFF